MRDRHFTMTTKIRIKLQTNDGQFITDVVVEHKSQQMSANTIMTHVSNHLDTTPFGDEKITYGMSIELMQP
jgi:hypothetical protein